MLLICMDAVATREVIARVSCSSPSGVCTLFCADLQVAESTPFAPLVRKEIGGFAWHLISELPSTKEQSAMVNCQTHQAYMVCLSACLYAFSSLSLAMHQRGGGEEGEERGIRCLWCLHISSLADGSLEEHGTPRPTVPCSVMTRCTTQRQVLVTASSECTHT